MINFLKKVLPKHRKLAYYYIIPSRTNVSLPIKECKLHLLTKGPPNTATMKKEDAISYYTLMQTVRRLERSAEGLYKSKIIRGFCHLYSGQEAVCMGMFASMGKDDSLITSYRAHGWSFLFNGSVQVVLSELTGVVDGCSRGKGGSMHMYGKRFYGGNGIVGAQVPLGVGIALALKYTGVKGVCFALYGDGASNQGQIFEVFNIAKLLKIPCIFVCENNGYGMGTSAARSTALPVYYTKADAIPGILVDGMDVFAVREATRFAIDYAVQNGPFVMEMATYRYSGHSLSDPGTSYRTREEVQEVRKTKDPINKLKKKIVEANFASEADLKKIEKTINDQVLECEKKAVKGTLPAVEELTTDIYRHAIRPTVRGILFDQKLAHKTLNRSFNKK